MGDYLKEESQKCYEPTVHVCEPLMQIGSSMADLREELNNIHVETDELKGLHEEIRQDGLRLQELLDGRVRLREKSTMVEIEVKQLEDMMKRVFLGRKAVVIEQDELDYIEKLGDYHRDNQTDVRRLSLLWIEGVNGHLVGALK